LITFKLALEAGTKREGRRKGVNINSLKLKKKVVEGRCNVKNHKKE
jgi:hypothetical protein